ncbi:ankyrin repeat-containing protein NPR4-like [Spinacia oleracea]|uniref:Ankyrin repeat-containing protein NPR4-like n=1 Tax=Spinacia oleracea TaxID=3562 RepID=A0ABM3RFW7_SPIOL|nr:ankyrin repeat-containing protein NPR4-like [Spinacia oleracea]
MELIRQKYPMPRSLYGMSEAATKENVNILLVIAVLLATITFAAGFTVPGGFDEQNGDPVLIRQAAFKVFIISDTYAMCCSMLALFSLIWVMTGRTSESLKLIDLSVFVLQQLFYGTTLAFMTSVYVAISIKALWTFILVCVLCSCLIICSLKPLNLRLSRIFPLIPGCLHTVATKCAWLPCIPCIWLAWLSGCCDCWDKNY